LREARCRLQGSVNNALLVLLLVACPPAHGPPAHGLPSSDLLGRCRATASAVLCASIAEEAEIAADRELAREAWSAGCEAGDARSCRKAAAAWEATSKDPLQAAVRWRMACTLGDSESCTEVALSRARGGDDTAGVKILLGTCSQPDARACNDLGVKLIGEEGRENLGRSLLKEACRLEVWAACGNLGRLARDGRFEPRDVEKGTKLLTIACSRGDATACLDVGDLAASSGASGDGDLAIQMYEQACFQDQAKGCERGSALLEAGGGDPIRRARLRARGCGLGSGALCDGGSSPGAPLVPPAALPQTP